ncbi:MAG: peptidylprolyl isomerase [Bacilli bacterium]|jgi:peptidyl-prolyl cis-trans isomerase B (cyclophilin B)|nr:peptidylprolyl isomerase [Bacilli bacterium]
MVTITMKGLGDIVVEMDYKDAPNSCRNFVALARKGFYDGLIFHRVIKNFMIQGGDPTGTGMGGPGYSIKGEFSQNGVNNKLSHKRGVLSMARSMDPDSAGSQFFICDHDDGFLDGQYAAFGKVASGMEVVDKIASVEKNGEDRPLVDVVIEKMSVSSDEPVEDPLVIKD